MSWSSCLNIILKQIIVPNGRIREQLNQGKYFQAVSELFNDNPLSALNCVQTIAEESYDTVSHYLRGSNNNANNLIGASSDDSNIDN